MQITLIHVNGISAGKRSGIVELVYIKEDFLIKDLENSEFLSFGAWKVKYKNIIMKYIFYLIYMDYGLKKTFSSGYTWNLAS